MTYVLTDLDKYIINNNIPESDCVKYIINRYNTGKISLYEAMRFIRED